MCSSPVWFNDKLYLMSAQISKASNTSHFCTFDGATGEELYCPDESSGYFFFSAIIDHGADKHPASGSSDRRGTVPKGHLVKAGGAPVRVQMRSKGKEPGCNVGAWTSTDLKT